MTRIYSILAILLFSLLRLAAEQQALGYHLALTVQKLEKARPTPKNAGPRGRQKYGGRCFRDGKSLRNLLLRTSLIVQRLTF